MDDRELMDKIRKSMEDTPVPESLKQPGRRKTISQKTPPHTDSGMPELPAISALQQRQSL